MNCPRCGSAHTLDSGKEFKFGVFDGKQYYCNSCGKHFKAFYREGDLAYTVPKTK